MGLARPKAAKLPTSPKTRPNIASQKSGRVCAFGRFGSGIFCRLTCTYFCSTSEHAIMRLPAMAIMMPIAAGVVACAAK